MNDNIYSGPSGLFACYLLHSLTKHVAYIGYTPDPRRRLRKHNREIAGGARETGKNGPWKMLLFVGGFSTEVSGLEFEHEWQEPDKTLISKRQVDCKASLIPEKCMAILKQLLQLKEWRLQPLRVCYLDLEWFQKYGIEVSGSYQPNYLFERGVNVPADQIYFSKVGHAELCTLCGNQLSNYNCQCYSCKKQFCMHCMAEILIGDSNELVPSRGQCVCGAELDWREILKRKQLSVAEQLASDSDTDTTTESEEQERDNEIQAEPQDIEGESFSSNPGENRNEEPIIDEEMQPQEVFDDHANYPISPIVNEIDNEAIIQISPTIPRSMRLSVVNKGNSQDDLDPGQLRGIESNQGGGPIPGNVENNNNNENDDVISID